MFLHVQNKIIKQFTLVHSRELNDNEKKSNVTMTKTGCGWDSSLNNLTATIFN